MSRAIFLSFVAAILISGCRQDRPVLPAPSPPTQPAWSTSESIRIGADGKRVREAVVQTIKDMEWTIATEMKTTTGGAIEAASPSGERVRIRFQSKESGASTDLRVESAAGTTAATSDELVRRIEELAPANSTR